MQKEKKEKMNKKGTVTLYLIIIIAAIIITLIASFMAPLGILFTSEMYEAGEDIIERTNSSIQDISDVEIRAAIEDTIGEAKGATQTNIDVLGSLYQYGWIIAIGLVGLVGFLQTRQIVEYGGRII